MNFDTVIAFEENSDIMRIVSCIKSHKRIIWVHCDYSRIYKKAYNQAFKYVDSIVCVSKYTKNIFIGLFPSLCQKTNYIHNILDESKISLLGKEKVDLFSSEHFNIVSVGRLDPVKQFTLIPSILSKAKTISFKDIRWYIIGDYDVPGEKENILSEIEKYHLKEDVLLLGVKVNPYKYMKHADLIVSTSKSEACPYVINEAKILGTPIVCNNFGSSNEFIDNFRTGIICTINDMPQTIINMVDNKDNCYSDIKETLKSYRYPNGTIIEQIKSII